jgi:hypothetical protein
VSTVSSPCNPRPLVDGVTRGGPELGPSNDSAGPKINQTCGRVDDPEGPEAGRAPGRPTQAKKPSGATVALVQHYSKPDREELHVVKSDDFVKSEKESKNCKVNDELTESKTAADWRIGKIDAPPRTGRDIIMSRGETLTESSSRAVLSGPEVVTEEPKSQTEPVQGELFLTKVVAGADIQTLQCTNLPDRGNLRISLRFSYGNIYLAKRGEESRGEENEDKILNTDHLYKAVLMV